MASPNEITFARTKAFFRSQLLTTLSRPCKRFTDQTIIITGSNTGIGLEAARHFLRLDAKLVVLAVRDLAKGARARDDLLSSCCLSSEADRVQVWQLDLARYGSVLRFTERADRELERVDVLVSNAAMYVVKGGFRRAPGEDGREEGQEEITTRVNVLCTMMLAILLLPKLRETSCRYSKETVCTFTGSFVHFMTDFPERKADDIFGALADAKTARMGDRYNVTKLIELLLVRQLAHHVTSSSEPGNIVVSLVNPGAVRTDIMREAGFFFRLYLRFLYLVMMRTAEEGSRTIISAAEGGPETHGQYLDDCKVGRPCAWVESEEGDKIAKQLWKELSERLEAQKPGIMDNI